MIIAGSIIAGNLLNIEEIIKISEENNIDWLHLDIMDGNFVPNITFGLEFVKLIRKKTKLPIDIHLMVNNPEKYTEYAKYCDMINFHIETTHFPIRLTKTFKNINASLKVGVALNPCTPIEKIVYLENYIDNILIMTVEPGFAGQEFIYNTLPKIEKAKEITRSWKNEVFISVDGGINENSYEIVLRKGANYLVCASYLYKDYNTIKEKIKLIRNSS